MLWVSTCAETHVAAQSRKDGYSTFTFVGEKSSFQSDHDNGGRKPTSLPLSVGTAVVFDGSFRYKYNKKRVNIPENGLLKFVSLSGIGIVISAAWHNGLVSHGSDGYGLVHPRTARFQNRR